MVISYPITWKSFWSSVQPRVDQNMMEEMGSHLCLEVRRGDLPATVSITFTGVVAVATEAMTTANEATVAITTSKSVAVSTANAVSVASSDDMMTSVASSQAVAVPASDDVMTSVAASEPVPVAASDHVTLANASEPVADAGAAGAVAAAVSAVVDGAVDDVAVDDANAVSLLEPALLPAPPTASPLALGSLKVLSLVVLGFFFSRREDGREAEDHEQQQALHVNKNKF